MDRQETTIQEPARSVPVRGRYDVVVCGGGPAGVAAACSAARSGALTLLIERQGQLGGIWTTGLLSWMLDCGGKPGFMRELIADLSADGFGRVSREVDFLCDPERLKLVLERKTESSGVHSLYNASIVSAVVDGHSVTHVVTESASGREAWSAAVFVDATGDGDLSFRAGCGYDYGHPETGLTQPATLMMLVDGLAPADCGPYDATPLGLVPDAKDRLLAEMKRAGVVPSYPKPTLFHIGRGLCILMSNHEHGVRGIDAGEVTKATIAARRELHMQIDGLRSLGGIWRDLRIVATGAHLGIREGRRVHGEYTVRKQDLLDGRRHADGICLVTFPFDVHATRKSEASGFEHPKESSLPYDIPLRSLIAKDRRNLLLAGRCISGDFWAHSSYRVTGNAVRLGEAAGVLAAVAAEAGTAPRDIPFSRVAPVLPV